MCIVEWSCVFHELTSIVLFTMQENGEAPPPAGADMDTDKTAETAEAEAAKPKKQVKKIQLPVDALDELTSAEVNKYQVRIAAALHNTIFALV